MCSILGGGGSPESKMARTLGKAMSALEEQHQQEYQCAHV